MKHTLCFQQTQAYEGQFFYVVNTKISFIFAAVETRNLQRRGIVPATRDARRNERILTGAGFLPSVNVLFKFPGVFEGCQKGRKVYRNNSWLQRVV